jgi:hypothetical protein
MAATKTVREREQELRALMATPAGRETLDALAAHYGSQAGGYRPGRSSVITYIIVCERTRGLIAG